MASWTENAKNSMFGTDDRGNLVIRNAVIMQGKTKNGGWTNFSGRPTVVNPRGGKRTFNVVLPEPVAQQMMAEGWNVKMIPPLDDQGDTLYYTEVVLNMEKSVEPVVYLCTEWNGNKKKTRLHGDDVKMLDNVRFRSVDVNIYPHVHDKGIKGHCNQFVAVQAQDMLFGGAYDEYSED